MTDITAPQISSTGPGLLVQAIRYPWVALILLSFLFIGGDVLAFRIGGMTFRFVAFTILAAAAMDILRASNRVFYDRGLIAVSSLLTLAACLSISQSYDTVRTIGYTIWMIFSFWVIIPLFFNFARDRPLEETIRVWFGAYRIQIGLLILEIGLRYATGTLALTTLGRPHLWFYEPSYAAIYFSAYLAASLYYVSCGMRRFGWDVIAASVGCLALASTTAIFGFGIAVFLVAMLSPYRWRMLGATAVVVTVVTAILVVYFSSTPYFKLILGFFSHAKNPLDIIVAILARAGNRIPRAIVSWYAFVNHPWTGIGFGADQPYTTQVPGATLSQRYGAPWLSYRGSPFINPYLEAGGTMGAPGLVGLLLLTVDMIRRFLRLAKSHDPNANLAKGVFVGFFAMFLALQIEGTFLRFYVWSTFGLAYGAAACWLVNRPSGKPEDHV